MNLLTRKCTTPDRHTLKDHNPVGRVGFNEEHHRIYVARGWMNQKITFALEIANRPKCIYRLEPANEWKFWWELFISQPTTTTVPGAAEHGSSQRTQSVWFISCGWSEVDQPPIFPMHSCSQIRRPLDLICVTFLYVGWLHHSSEALSNVGRYLCMRATVVQKMVCRITCRAIMLMENRIETNMSLGGCESKWRRNFHPGKFHCFHIFSFQIIKKYCDGTFEAPVPTQDF